MAAAGGTGHLVEDFDGTFQNCLSAIMRQEHFNVNDQEETKCSVEQCIQRFFDVARQLEIFFLQKRMLLSAQKPEQIIKEDIADLRLELSRKEQLIQRHYDRLQQWQTILNRQPQPSQTAGANPQPSPMNQGQPPTPQPPHSTATPQPPPQAAVTVVPQPQPQQMHHGHPQSPHPHPQLQTQHSQPGMPHGMMGPMGGMPQPQPPQLQPQFPQGPLAYLEQTTSNIGMPERH